MEDKLTTITHTINHNTDVRIEASTDTLKMHATNIHNIMSAMAVEFQHSNSRIHNIMQTLAATTPDPLKTNIARHPHTPSTSLLNAHEGDTNPPQQAPPGFSNALLRNSPSSLHKGQHHSYE